MPRTKNNTNANANTGANAPKAPDFIKVQSFEVKRAREVSYNGKTSVLADVTINGVTIYGLKAITYTKPDGTESDFIGWPERQGKDGNWYKIAYAPLSNGDQEVICNAIYQKLDGNG